MKSEYFNLWEVSLNSIELQNYRNTIYYIRKILLSNSNLILLLYLGWGDKIKFNEKFQKIIWNPKLLSSSLIKKILWMPKTFDANNEHITSDI